MAHKTLIDGTAYEVSGGKTLIDGTAYSIDKGKARVDGTAYEVGFVKMATVTITGQTGIMPGQKIVYVEIDGVTYTEATEISVPIGTVITCHGGYLSAVDKGGVVLNGTIVATTETYEYTVTGAVKIELAPAIYTQGVTQYYYGTVYITEQ